MDEINFDLLKEECESVISTIKDVETDEQINKLKVLACKLRATGQQNDNHEIREHLALTAHYLSDDYFLNHQYEEVRLYVAWCITEILKLQASHEHSYKGAYHHQLKKVFLFFIEQLVGLKDPDDCAYKLRFVVLENLAHVKMFLLCFELDDCQSIFCLLFSTVFKIINKNNSYKMKNLMLTILCSVIEDSDVVSDQLRDIILRNILEPHKSHKKNVYDCTKDFIIDCGKSFEPYIHAFIKEKELSSPWLIDELREELKLYCRSAIKLIYHLLSVRLESSDENTRLDAINQIEMVFSDPDSYFRMDDLQDLLKCFLASFDDPCVAIRLECVKYSSDLLHLRPSLRQDITNMLKKRQHDVNKKVRYQVVMAIASVAKKDLDFVLDTELIGIVRSRTLDKHFEIREVAMTELVSMYHRVVLNDDPPNVPEETKKSLSWITETVLCSLLFTLDRHDEILAEKLLTTYLVPACLSTDQRMKQLYRLFATIDSNATKCFIAILKRQINARETVLKWLTAMKTCDETSSAINCMVYRVAQLLPHSVRNKNETFIKEFGNEIMLDSTVFSQIETILQPTVSCIECTNNYNDLLEQLQVKYENGPSGSFQMIQLILDRISSIIIDADAIRMLVEYVTECLNGENVLELDLDPNDVGVKGSELLEVLASTHGPHFLHNDVITKLISFVKENNDEVITTPILSIFRLLGHRYDKPIFRVSPELSESLNTICKTLAQSGSPKQVKSAILCLSVNAGRNDEIFSELIDYIQDSLDPTSNNYRTAIVALGYIGQCYNKTGEHQIKMRLMVLKVIEELFRNNDREIQNNSIAESDWCPEDELPEETRCQIEGLKCVARCSIGPKSDCAIAREAFRLFHRVLEKKGDVSIKNKIMSEAEMSWMRLKAGCSMLKMCKKRGVGDLYDAQQFYALSHLMMDQVLQVRNEFARKLHKGLIGSSLPHNCLPSEFVGIFAFGGKQEDKKLKQTLKQYMLHVIKVRMEYVKLLLMNHPVETVKDQLHRVSLDNILIDVVKVLAHDPAFTRHNPMHLTVVKKCLQFVFQTIFDTKDMEIYCKLCGPFMNETIRDEDFCNPEDNDMEVFQKILFLCELVQINEIYLKMIYKCQANK